MRQPSAIPRPARCLGFAALVPFVAAAVAGILPVPAPPGAPVHALLAYGAVILPFLGGIRWGLGMAASAGAVLRL